MKLKFLLVAAVLAVTIAACSPANSTPSLSSTSPTPVSSLSSASPTPAPPPSNLSSTPNQDIAQAVDPNTQPIKVTTTLDESHTATAFIGPDGGKLNATSADGSRFTLEIPPKALEETIEVSMTPITAMDGLPWKSGPVAAVQLEPDGQTFYDYVTLTIEPASAIPVDQVIPIGASGPDHSAYIPNLDPKSKGLKLKLDHFSSAGATKCLLADIEPWRQRLGGDVEARLQSIVAAEIANARQAELTGQNPTVDPAFWDYIEKTWRQYVLNPRLAAAGQNCAAGRLAIQTVISMERQFELGGVPFSSGVDWADLLPKVAKVCVQEEYELCRDQHIIHRIIPVIPGLARQNELLGAHDEGQDASALAAAMGQIEAQGWDLARKCLQFELDFQSTAKMATTDGSYTSTVEATVKIELNTDTFKLEGTGELINTDFSMKPKKCTAVTSPGGGTFKVISVDPIAAPPDASHPYGYVKALHLTYAPGNSSEKVTEKCPQGTVNYPPMHLWTLAYEALHSMETAGSGPGNSAAPDIGSILGGMGISNLPSVPGMPQLPGQGGSGQASQDNGPTFTATQWAVRNGELFAQKEWSLSVNLKTTGTEDGSFKLYHKPQ